MQKTPAFVVTVEEAGTNRYLKKSAYHRRQTRSLPAAPAALPSESAFLYVRRSGV
jgi:hypothetical protein